MSNEIYILRLVFKVGLFVLCCSRLKLESQLYHKWVDWTLDISLRTIWNGSSNAATAIILGQINLPISKRCKKKCLDSLRYINIRKCRYEKLQKLYYWHLILYFCRLERLVSRNIGGMWQCQGLSLAYIPGVQE
jgi:hypothetical protein